MNILVVSDSHRALYPLRRVLALYGGQIGMAVHLGDHADDLLRLQAAYKTLTFHAVAGNCDGGAACANEKIVTVNGRRILLTHGHLHNVKMHTDRLAYYAQEQEAAVCLYGHTHASAVFDAGPVLMMNPGSIGQPRTGEQPSYGLLTVSDTGVLRAVTLTLADGV